MVVDLQGRCMPRHSSPILEAQAFTIFDEARCRGADLQLGADAVGLLTLGPTTCKDKLMQAAGRLRKLGKGQTLRIVGTADVTAKISKACKTTATYPTRLTAAKACASLTSREVLAWVMQNTVQATEEGLLQWSAQGLLFAATKGAPEHAPQDEVLELDELYSSSRSLCPVSKVVADLYTRRLRSNLAGDVRELMGTIVERAKLYGANHQVVSQGVLGEECERELEQVGAWLVACCWRASKLAARAFVDVLHSVHTCSYCCSCIVLSLFSCCC
jgi:hypothetical protein